MFVRYVGGNVRDRNKRRWWEECVCLWYGLFGFEFEGRWLERGGWLYIGVCGGVDSWEVVCVV